MDTFVDTNVVLYLLSADGRKAAISERLLMDGPVTSVQVLNESANVARRKAKMEWNEIARFIERLKAICDVRPLTVAIHDDGRRLAERYRLSIDDAMIVAPALDAKVERLLSEDIQHGLVIDEVLTVTNPYR